MSIKRSELILFILLSLSILPIINIRGFDLPVLFLLIPFGIVVFILVLLGKVKIPRVTKVLILFFSLIIIEIFLSSFIGSITAFNKIIFPNDVIQYVARFLCVLTFLLFFYHSKIKIETFIKLFLIVLIGAMSVGVLQWFSWPGQQFFINLYPFRDGSLQLSQLDRTLHTRRIHGFAQMATANSGMAMFAFVFASSILSYTKKFKYLSIVLIVLALVNVLASQGRAGMVALVFAIILFYILRVYIYRKSLKPTIKIIIGAAITFLIGHYLYLNENPFITQLLFRWEVLFETSGGARTQQIEYGLSLMSNLYHYLFGISRVFQSHSGIPFHLEVEFVNILVLYGLLGFILQYSLVIYLLWYFFKNIRKFLDNPYTTSLLVASFVMLASYQVFSLGYFFFREIRVGLIPWSWIGVTIGVCERYKRKKIKTSIIALNEERSKGYVMELPEAKRGRLY